MYDTFTFNKIRTRVTRDNLDNGCYISNSSQVLDVVNIDEDYMEELFDPILELFYNILQKRENYNRRKEVDIMKMRVVSYARYSSNNQREESIDAQLRAIEEYAKQNNMLIIKTYIDRAMSGTKDDRPKFMQMIMDSKKKIFDAVIVHKLNRFS